MQLTITAGKRYVTRGGAEARIYATDGEPDAPVHGAIKGAYGWSAHDWQIGGAWKMDGSESRHDLTFEIATSEQPTE